MSSFRPTDSKREEFRKYLERAGVMDALTKVLVSLYEEPEKPVDALEYLKAHLGAGEPDKAEVETLRQELDLLKAELETLKAENADLKTREGGDAGGGSGPSAPPSAAPSAAPSEAPVE